MDSRVRGNDAPVWRASPTGATDRWQPLMPRDLEARLHPRLDEIDAAHWDALRPDDNPFVSHAWLAGLERHGCIDAEHGWVPQHLALYDRGALVAAAPLYVKLNSHGEYVFDWSWASAYQRSGLDYYPKLLCAVPYSPVTGPRLLVGDGDAALRGLLIDTLATLTQ